jgi:hypothetical protein
MEESKAVLVTVKEAAAMAAVSPDWLVRQARANKAAWYRKLGYRTTRVDVAAFTAWLVGRRGR